MSTTSLNNSALTLMLFAGEDHPVGIDRDVIAQMRETAKHEPSSRAADFVEDVSFLYDVVADIIDGEPDIASVVIAVNLADTSAKKVA